MQSLQTDAEVSHLKLELQKASGPLRSSQRFKSILTLCVRVFSDWHHRRREGHQTQKEIVIINFVSNFLNRSFVL